MQVFKDEPEQSFIFVLARQAIHQSVVVNFVKEALHVHINYMVASFKYINTVSINGLTRIFTWTKTAALD